jgi:hypothetical protein
VGDEWHAKSDGGRRDPPVTVVDLVAESVADPLAGGPQPRARGDHLIVGLDDGQLRYAALETPGAKLAPLGSHRAEPQLHHGVEREQDGRVADELPVLVSERVRPVVEQPADDHGVHDDAQPRGVRHHSVSASRNAAHSSSGTSSITRSSRRGSGRALLSASSGGYTRNVGSPGCWMLDTTQV